MIRWRRNVGPALLGPPQRLYEPAEQEEEETHDQPHRRKFSYAQTVTQRSSQGLVGGQKGSSVDQGVGRKENTLCVAGKVTVPKSKTSKQHDAALHHGLQSHSRAPLRPLGQEKPHLTNELKESEGKTTRANSDSKLHPASTAIPLELDRNQVQSTQASDDSQHHKAQLTSSSSHDALFKIPTTYPATANVRQERPMAALSTQANGTYNNSLNQQPSNSSCTLGTLHKTPTTHPVTADVRQKGCTIQSTSTTNGHSGLSGVYNREQVSECANTDDLLQRPAGNKVPSVGLHLANNFDVVEFTHGQEVRRYTKLAVLGYGGSSKVFKVISEDAQLYALKEVYIKNAPNEIKSAYINEVKLLKKLKGQPEIITLFDYFYDKEQGIIYLLLEHGNTDLSKVLKCRKDNTDCSFTHLRTCPAFLHSVWYQMLCIVKVIHREGVIHNDLKPENFVFCGPFLKLIDFGIANRIELDHTSVERDIRCGTANFMAPETISTYEDRDVFKVGRPADVWSLGCILYQMVYQRTPFEHLRNKVQKWQAITDQAYSITFPSITCSSTLEVLQLCLRRNPKERPTVEQLLSHPVFTTNSLN